MVKFFSHWPLDVSLNTAAHQPYYPRSHFSPAQLGDSISFTCKAKPGSRGQHAAASEQDLERLLQGEGAAGEQQQQDGAVPQLLCSGCLWTMACGAAGAESAPQVDLTQHVPNKPLHQPIISECECLRWSFYWSWRETGALLEWSCTQHNLVSWMDENSGLHGSSVSQVVKKITLFNIFIAIQVHYNTTKHPMLTLRPLTSPPPTASYRNVGLGKQPKLHAITGIPEVNSDWTL